MTVVSLCLCPEITRFDDFLEPSWSIFRWLKSKMTSLNPPANQDQDNIAQWLESHQGPGCPFVCLSWREQSVQGNRTWTASFDWRQEMVTLALFACSCVHTHYLAHFFWLTLIVYMGMQSRIRGESKSHVDSTQEILIWPTGVDSSWYLYYNI